MTCAIALALLATALPAWADDGGSDLPDSWSSARDVPLGTYSGDVGGSDAADWYRVEVPAGMHLHVDFAMPNGPHVHLGGVSDAGAYLFEDHVSPTWWGNASDPATLSLDLSGPAFRIGVESLDQEAATYTIAFEAVASPDFAVSHLQVTPVPVRTDQGDVATGTLRTIDVDVSNLGLGAGSGDVVLTARTTSDGKVTTIADVPMSLEPGAGQHVQVSWNALDSGAVGDVEVTATVIVWLDADPSNNAAHAETYSVVGGTGRGVTLSENAASCVGYLVYECPFLTASPGGVLVGQIGLGLVAGDVTAAQVSPEGVAVVALAYGPAVDVIVYADHDVGAGGDAEACGYVLVGACEHVALP